jgi:chromosome partitioning protein
VKITSIINLKGGVAKTLTATSMAHILATKHNKHVLLIDNDKQGNTSKAFGVHSYDEKSVSDILTARRINPQEVIKKTAYGNIDVMPANMTLIRANLEVMMDSTRPQQTRLRDALGAIAGNYDYCLVDNAPDINISTINALVASNDVIIPIKIDEYAFDGLAELKEQIENTRDDLNPRLQLAGCLITCFQRTEADRQGEEWLRKQPGYRVFETHIRYSEKVTESTFAKTPIVEYSRRSGAATDYIAFVCEYLRDGANCPIRTERGV